MMRLAVLRASLVLAACGQIGFGESRVGELDGASDAGGVIPDGVDPDALVGCGQAPPFLQLIDVIVIGNPSTQTVRYCSAGLAGPLDASIRMQDESVFAETLGAPIAPGSVGIFIGSPNCMGCFVRLAANGIVFDGPISDFIGE